MNELNLVDRIILYLDKGTQKKKKNPFPQRAFCTSSLRTWHPPFGLYAVGQKRVKGLRKHCNGFFFPLEIAECEPPFLHNNRRHIT